MIGFVIFTASLVGILAFTLTAVVRRYALRQNMIDLPNARSSHQQPKPRGGGLALVAAFASALVLLTARGEVDVRLCTTLLFSGGLVAGAGFLDDRASLPPLIRLLVQLLAATVFLVVCGTGVEGTLAPVGIFNPVLATVMIVLGLVWSTNLFNFMDGIDGIAASEAAFVAAAGALIIAHRGERGLSELMLYLASACLGFLVWNWPPSRIFLGDVGSGFLGLMLAMLALVASVRTAVPVQVWLILSGTFFADATVTLFRRLARGERLWHAHRLHGYQKLSRRWNSHAAVTMLYGGVNVFWLLPWALYAAANPVRANFAAVFALTPIVILVGAIGAGKASDA